MECASAAKSRIGMLFLSSAESKKYTINSRSDSLGLAPELGLRSTDPQR